MLPDKGTQQIGKAFAVASAKSDRDCEAQPWEEQRQDRKEGHQRARWKPPDSITKALAAQQ